MKKTGSPGTRDPAQIAWVYIVIGFQVFYYIGAHIPNQIAVLVVTGRKKLPHHIHERPGKARVVGS